jgi:plasmid replication initiation protein
MIKQQLTLPLFENESLAYKAKVKQNWSFTFSKQFISSVYSKRVIALALGQIKQSGDVSEVYHIRALDLVRQLDTSSRQDVYKCMKDVIYELSNICFYISSEDGETVIPRHLLDTTRYDNPVSYNNGVLTIAFNPTLHNNIKELSHYSQYELDSFLSFSSWYSMRIWELLSAYKDKGWWQVPIDEYRDLMGCGPKLNEKGKPMIKKGKVDMKYPKNGDMIKHTTKEPLEELKGTELEFTLTTINGQTTGSGRPSITHLLFELKTKQLSTKDQIKILEKKYPNTFPPVYDRLKKWEVSDENIAKYIVAIGSKRINQLLFNWQERNMPGSKTPIQNKEKFCNVVMIEEGEKALLRIKESEMYEDVTSEEIRSEVSERLGNVLKE